MEERSTHPGAEPPVKSKGGRPRLEPGLAKSSRSFRLAQADWKVFDRLCASKGWLPQGEMMAKIIHFAAKADLDSI